MKNKIMESKPVKLLTRTPFSRYLGKNRFFSKFWNYEMVTYLIAGALTTLVNYLVYFLMPRFEGGFIPGLDIIIANISAWTISVLFAFFVNKIFVFDSPAWNARTLYREFIPFVGCRLASLGLETAIIYAAVGLLKLNEPLFKILASILVLLANYFASKFFIFKKSNKEA